MTEDELVYNNDNRISIVSILGMEVAMDTIGKFNSIDRTFFVDVLYSTAFVYILILPL